VEDASVAAQRRLRTDLVDSLERELLGPSEGETEQIENRPTLRYLLGRLAPAGTAVSPDEDDGAADAGADDDGDAVPASPISQAMNPSSIGLSFIVGPSIESLAVSAEWGSYSPVKVEHIDKDGKAHQRTVWAREPHSVPFALHPAGSGSHELESGVCLQWLVRERADGRRAISVFLVNRIIASDPIRPDDVDWIFQPRLAVRHASDEPIFQARSLDDLGDLEVIEWDRRSDELLYRDRPEYAVGHGCAADWSADGANGATEVSTVILPMHELPRIDPREDPSNPGLDMRRLGGTSSNGVPAEELIRLLSPMADEYRQWIDSLEARVDSLDPRLRAQAAEHVDACRLAHERMVEGIELLGRKDESGRIARLSFCFANRAMALQRAHSVVALRRRRGLEPGDPAKVVARWRPFQLAFALMNLPPLVDRTHSQRRTADLLWFPTGGGKTEAYLGLTAFVLALRRYRRALPGRRASGGVAVLMRYTLRLLTVQQFQRATALICACEYLRVTEGSWGDEPFSIGLWVGMSATPNRYSDPDGFFGDGAKEALQKWKDGQRIKGGTPAQLLGCPWCGATLGPSDYDADDLSESVKVFCSDDSCDFSPANDHGINGIPAHTVDEQLYRAAPSLVIATVDKFAQMAWNGRVQSLFGGVQRSCERHGYISTGENHPNKHPKDGPRGWPAATVQAIEPFEPPDLIIQDELHLISGPLGTLVGLYETAVDALASARVGGDLIPPKVIASTATIRRADKQVASLFHRGISIFPPSGLESTDSWFGTEVPTTEAPGRLYVGIFGPGKSVKTALVRVYAGLLSRAKALHNADPDLGDAYMTLVGYFNSLRELGGAVRLAEDDIPGRIGVLHRRSHTDWPDRLLYEREELTSNKSAEEIPAILSRLERMFPAGKPETGKYPIDLLFASNMISVGVDVDRLGLMVVNGQPKTTAEYIQATSRVGRQTPGLVVTVYNWTRPRDISHYERFRSYHSALYRFVEPTSVTPFSSRARDKGLAGVLASIIRQGDPTMAPGKGASSFDATEPWVKQAVEWISARAESVVSPAAGADTRAELRSRIDDWVKVTDSDLAWAKRDHGPKPDPQDHWLIDPQEELVRKGPFVAPGSLREVEAEVHVHLLGMDA
jgi:hypothetical protein